MVGIMARLGARGRHSGANAIVHLSREVVGRRRTIQSGLQEVRNPGILDALADEDFRVLDTTISERTQSDRAFALTLARLTHAGAKAKGFDRCVVDTALRLDSLLPADDPERERDKLLRDAYGAAQRASYIRGGRLALGRLGRRAVESGDLERARVLLQQQLDLGPEKDDSPAEVDSALVLGDILRREGERDAAQMLYRRAGQAAQKLEYHQGVAESLVRQIDITPPESLETVAALQRQALDAAQRTGDLSLEARILLGLAETLAAGGRLEDAAKQFEDGLRLARETNDLALEARCVTALATAYRELGNSAEALTTERAALAIEERLGNRHAAALWAIQLGSSELDLGHSDAAVDAFDRARMLAHQINDAAMEQRAEGGLGVAFTLLKHPTEAIDHLTRAFDLARTAGDAARQAHWLASLSQAFWLFGQGTEAARATGQAIEAARAADDTALEAELYTLLGQIYASHRETIRARDCYMQALQLNRDLNQTAEQVTSLTALASLAADTGQYTQATQLFDQALGLTLSTGDRATAARLHGRIGRMAQKRGDVRAALGQFVQALDLAEATNDVRLLSQALQHLATAQHVAGDPTAVESYLRAIDAADAAGDVRGAISMRLNVGSLMGMNGHNGQREEGIELLLDAADIARDYGHEFDDLGERAGQLLEQAAPRQSYRDDSWSHNGGAERHDRNQIDSGDPYDERFRSDHNAYSQTHDSGPDERYSGGFNEVDTRPSPSDARRSQRFNTSHDTYALESDDESRVFTDDDSRTYGQGYGDGSYDEPDTAEYDEGNWDDSDRSGGADTRSYTNEYAADPEDHRDRSRSQRSQESTQSDDRATRHDQRTPSARNTQSFPAELAAGSDHDPYGPSDDMTANDWDEHELSYPETLDGADQGFDENQWQDDESEPSDSSERATQQRVQQRSGTNGYGRTAATGRHVRSNGRDIVERPGDVPEWWKNSRMNQPRQNNGRQSRDDELANEATLPPN